ncbi:uncharacterized protein LOC112587324 isoform X2 [Bubalus bubalis]|uniref:uncharacterized protein LOC112587324 isoform X2 n=1 Tax=Bubalus bubalis TaxID=89462 RepID=UPI001D120DD5|nr:uncharacterized protein LOC112587324 isoform X2 [Bubalus bubalis]
MTGPLPASTRPASSPDVIQASLMPLAQQPSHTRRPAIQSRRRSGQLGPPGCSGRLSSLHAGEPPTNRGPSSSPGPQETTPPSSAHPRRTHPAVEAPRKEMFAQGSGVGWRYRIEYITLKQGKWIRSPREKKRGPGMEQENIAVTCQRKFGPCSLLGALWCRVLRAEDGRQVYELCLEMRELCPQCEGGEDAE